MNEPIPGSKIKLSSFPPNRGMMDWNRVLHLDQTGIVQELYVEPKHAPIYAVWFSSHDDKEGWEIWLAREHFTMENTRG